MLKYANCLYAQRYSKRKQIPINYNKNFESIWLKNSIHSLKVLTNNIRQCHKKAGDFSEEEIYHSVKKNSLLDLQGLTVKSYFLDLKRI